MYLGNGYKVVVNLVININFLYIYIYISFKVQLFIPEQNEYWLCFHYFIWPKNLPVNFFKKTNFRQKRKFHWFAYGAYEHRQAKATINTHEWE